MNNLNTNDINTLIEALTVWERDEERESFQKSMLTTIFTVVGSDAKDRESAAEAAKRKGDEEMRKATLTTKMRREVSVLIQAKLLMMRNEVLKQETKVDQNV
ncbi:MAG TPA: hypothetical protein VFH87_00750 [Candidatus Udaeobacter sp.]|nr:hypothetical protein [Candidatus Udaeobacter sp.]